jgi:hypothetical protein
MERKRTTHGFLSAALLAAFAASAVPANAAATCNDIVNCVAACYDDRCTRECARYGDATSQALFSAAIRCLDTYCPYDTSESCSSRNCGYEINQCRADGGGSYGGTAAGYGGEPVYTGPLADGSIDNFTFKFGGGYVFVLDGGLLDMTMGWEHLWVFGPMDSASTVQLGIDLLFDMFTGGDVVVLAVGGALDVKYYFGTNILEPLPWFTFGLGAMIGGGTTIGAGWGEEDVPFLIAAPQVSLQWIYPFGGGFDFYGGAIVLFNEATDIAPYVGLRGVMDITLFASNI